MANSFEFTVDELNLVLEGLQELPFKRVGPLVTRLVNEFHAQNNATTLSADAIAAAAADPANIVPALPAPEVAASANRKARRAAKANGARR